MRWRFLNRKTFWARDGKSNPSIEDIDQNIEKLNFSSQYYFLLSSYANGIIFVIVSIVALMLRNFNFFGDPATLVIFIFVSVVYYMTELIFIKIGKLLNIWKINVEEEKRVDENLNCDIANFRTQSNNYVQSFISKDKGKSNPIMSIKNWERIKYLKEQEQFIEENLRTERMNLEITKNQFLNVNKKWLQANIGEILSPRTLVLNKKKIINFMKKQFGEKSPNLTLDSIKLDNYSEDEKGEKRKDKHNEISDAFNENNEKDENLEYKNYLIKKNLKINLIENTNLFKILSVWKNRASLSNNLMKNIELIIKNKKGKRCENCGSFYNLRSVNKTNILKFFLKFIKKHKFSVENYDLQLLRHEFYHGAKIETICEICYYDRLNKKI
jgi:hypothetical protein